MIFHQSMRSAYVPFLAHACFRFALTMFIRFINEFYPFEFILGCSHCQIIGAYYFYEMLLRLSGCCASASESQSLPERDCVA